MKEFVSHSVNDLNFIAKELLHFYSSRRIFAFYGSLGSGKTTFIKEICKLLNVKDTVTSPSFSIINEYKTFENDSVFHFDFYRIKNKEEVYDIGYEDYFYSGSYCLIEWPEKIKELLPANYVYVTINIFPGTEERVIAF